MADSVDTLDQLNVGGRVDVDAVASLQAPWAGQARCSPLPRSEVDEVDSSGFLGFFDHRYEDYAEQLDSAASSLRAADTAAQVLPDMVGADGERDYLLLFQNNAEIRATGGMPGSWARIHAEGGRIEMVEQGTASDFPTADEPVVPLTGRRDRGLRQGVRAVLSGPWLRPDFQRGAEMWKAHWERDFPRSSSTACSRSTRWACPTCWKAPVRSRWRAGR